MKQLTGHPPVGPESSTAGPLRWDSTAVALTALACAVSGTLSLGLAAPPSYASPVWPGAGIALAAVLLRGPGVWPGILLGSAIANLGLTLGPEQGVIAQRPLGPAVCIGTAATLQALLGAGAVRAVVGFPSALDRERDILLFLGITAPLASVVNAALGPLTLWAFGLLRPDALAFTCWTWWVGDTMGALIFTPLVLIFAAGPRAAPVWRARRAVLGAPLLLAFGLSVGAFAFFSQLEERRIEQRFQNQGVAVAQVIASRISSPAQVLRSLSSLYAASESVERAEFRAYARHLLETHPYIRVVEWIPRVPRTERTAFESAARREGLADFHFTERAPGGALVPAGERELYLPVYFVEPLRGNEKALGFDVGSDAVRAAALRAARRAGRPTASDPIQLVQNDGPGAGYLVATPLPSRAPGAGTGDGPGYLVVVFSAAPLIEEAARIVGYRGILLRVTDAGAAHTIYAEAAAPDTPPALHWSTELEMSGRTWALSFQATTEYLARQRTWASWLLPAGALLLCALLGAFLLVLTGRTARIEDLVHERTAQLKRAAERHRRQQETLEALLENAPDAVVIVDPRGEIVRVNCEAEALFGYARDALLGRPIEVLLPERLRGEHPQHVATYALARQRRGVRTGRPLVGRHRCGAEIPVDISLAPLETPEGPQIMSTIRDVTERRRTERALQERTRELTRSNEELQKFAYIASHDLQEPLRTVSSFMRLLRKRYRGRLDAEADQMIGFAADGADRMQALIHGLLEYSRVGLRGEELVPCELSKPFTWATENLRLAIEEREARIEHDPLPRVLGDERQLGQLLQNLIGNALKFQGDETPEIHVGARREGDCWHIAVRDNGIGIDPQHQAVIFEIFRRLHRQEYAGTGVGLAICKRIVERHGGEIRVESDGNKGACFEFTLPAAD